LSEPTVFYKKVGKKYVAVSQSDEQLLDAFPYGHYLVSCIPGRTSRSKIVNPDYASVVAATYVAEDSIFEEIENYKKIKPASEPLTQEQVDAWKNFNEAMKSNMTIYYPSNAEIVAAARRAIEQEAINIMKNPTVRKAWEQFQLIVKLTKDEKNDHA
jgi:hypothetical protein